MRDWEVLNRIEKVARKCSELRRMLQESWRIVGNVRMCDFFAVVTEGGQKLLRRFRKWKDLYEKRWKRGGQRVLWELIFPNFILHAVGDLMYAGVRRVHPFPIS